MSHPRTDLMLDAIEKTLKEAGVKDFIIMLAAPDDNEDTARWGGSVWWRLGAGRIVQMSAEKTHRDGAEQIEDRP